VLVYQGWMPYLCHSAETRMAKHNRIWVCSLLKKITTFSHVFDQEKWPIHVWYYLFYGVMCKNWLVDNILSCYIIKLYLLANLNASRASLFSWCLVPSRMRVTTVLHRRQYTKKVTEFTTRVAALCLKLILPPTNVTETVYRHQTAMGRWR